MKIAGLLLIVAGGLLIYWSLRPTPASGAATTTANTQPTSASSASSASSPVLSPQKSTG